MYEDIVFQEGVDLGAIRKNNYQPGNLTAIGKFDFKGIKGNIYGKASIPYTTIELYAPKDWFKEKPDFSYRMRGEGIGPYRLEPDKEYYRLPDAGLYNNTFYKAAASEEAAKEMIYESMANVLQEYIPQIFEEKLKISPKDQEDKLTVYLVTDYQESFSCRGEDASDYAAPVAIYLDKSEAEKEFKFIFESCETDGHVYTNEELDTISYEEALKAGKIDYYMPDDVYYGQAELSQHEFVLSKEQQDNKDVTFYLVEELHQLPGDSFVKIFMDKKEAAKEYASLVSAFSPEEASKPVHVSGSEYIWDGDDDCGKVVIYSRHIKLQNKHLSAEKPKNKGLLMEELRKNKPLDVLKKAKLQYEDISKVGEYYYKLAELKDNELIPQYDKDREIIKEMIQDGLKDARIRVVFMNIEDRRNIPHQNHVAAILKEPIIKQYKTMFRQRYRAMQKQR